MNELERNMRKLWEGLHTPITQILLPTFKSYWFRPVDFNSGTYLVIHAQDTEDDAPVWSNSTEMHQAMLEARDQWEAYYNEGSRNRSYQNTFNAFRKSML